MNIAILTMFNGLSKTYSLVSVVEEQLNMLLDAGMEVKLLVSQDCPESDRHGIFLDERIHWVRITNRYQGELIHWRDYTASTGSVHPTFFDEAAGIAADFVRALSDVEVCIVHDILYQGWHLLHNVALRQAQEDLPRVRFIAMNHSLPVIPPNRTDWPFSARFSPLPNTTFVYPTLSGLSALALQYRVAESLCRPLYNCLNPLAHAGEDLRRLAGRTDLLSPDILIVYPGRLTTGKQFEKAAALAGAVSVVSDLTVKIVFCDFPSMDIDPQTYKSRIREEGYGNGLAADQIVFTSDCGWPDGFPHIGVMELFGLSNLFVCPSYSESFGLIVLEAASRGNFLVLNQAVPALEELGQHLNAYFMRWNARNMGFDTSERYHPSEQAYLLEHASRIVQLMRDNPVLHAKTLLRSRYNPQWVWKNQLEPLLANR